MQIIPKQTKPPMSPTNRQHNPKHAAGKRGYQQYRSCLRWEFGFTCPFCLLHEADFDRSGCAEGTGLTGVEHFIPQSTDSSARNEYSNCVYCCRFCNGARSNIPVKHKGYQLLDPTTVAWADHFEVDEDRLIPKQDDPNADYTHESYDLNEPRKVRLRSIRRRMYTHHLPIVIEGPRIISDLMELAEEYTKNPKKASELESCARLLQQSIRMALEDLKTYSAVPQDAPKRCRCNNVELSLPIGLESQVLELRSRDQL